MSEPLILNRYRLLERLAAGGSAEVWRARDEQLGRDVAVKRLHSHLVPDEASRKRLAAEARAAAGLSHPVIVAIYDVDATGEPPSLVMELVDGESLATRIARDGPLPATDAAAMAADVAEALFHAHQRGVIHRDVKPGNVLLSSDGRIRLVDFGIAHSLAPAAERLTLTGTVVGTLHAMAPEQLAAGPITPRTDLYGLGVVLHEALTGRPPYPTSSPVVLAEAQRAGAPPLDGVDPALAAVVAGCLAVNPDDRPLHAGAVAEALRAWLAGNSAPALALRPSGAAVDTSAVTLARPAVAAAAADAFAQPVRPVAQAMANQRVGRRVGRRAPLAALGALVVLAIAAFVFLGPDPDGRAGAGTTPSPTISPTPTVTAAPTAFDVGALPRPVADEVRKWWEECGTEGQAPPFNVSGMNKREAEDALKPLREACEEGD